MRLFVAAVPPPDAIAHLAQAVEPVRDSALRWSGIETWHVTLAFYGEISDTALGDLTERVGRAAARYPPLEVRLAGAGRFGDTVVWTGVRGEVETLRRLARSMAAAGRRAGAAQDARRFRPHVTLARAKNQADLRGYVDQLSSYVGPVWTVHEVTLFRSHLGGLPGTGPRYEVLQRYGLTAVR